MMPTKVRVEVQYANGPRHWTVPMDYGMAVVVHRGLVRDGIPAEAIDIVPNTDRLADQLAEMDAFFANMMHCPRCGRAMHVDHRSNHACSGPPRPEPTDEITIGDSLRACCYAFYRFACRLVWRRDTTPEDCAMYWALGVFATLCFAAYRMRCWLYGS